MSTKKILSTVVMTTLAGSSFLPGITHAAINVGGTNASQTIQDSTSTSNYENSYEDSPYYSTKKIQKFLTWEDRILSYMTKDYKTTVIKLKNANAKKAYTAEYIDITESVKEVFSEAKYGYDSSLPGYITSLKKEIKTYKALRKELVSLAGSTLNPFSIPEIEINSIESDMIDFQKIFTKAAREALDKYNSSDLKETGKMDMNVEGNFGKIDFSLEKYTSIMSILTRSQEVDIVASAKFSINMPGSYDYNETTEEYEQGEEKVVTWDVRIDAVVKIIDKDMYVTLNDYSLNTNLTGTEKESLEKNIKELAQYKGKTFKIPTSSSLSTSGNINQAEALGQFKKVLDILDSKSLLTVYKKIGDTYTMTLKDSTIQSIGEIYGQEISPSNITTGKKTMREMPLRYNIVSGKKTLFISDETGIMSLSLKDGAYSFIADLKNPKKSGESVYIRIEKDFMEGKVLVEGVNVNLLYKDKNLLLTAEGYAQNLKIEWVLSKENTNINLTLNGKKLGNVSWKKTADTYSYDILFETTITEVLNKFHMSGESTMTKGTFPIVAPKDFIEKKSSSYSGDDTTLPSDFSDFE